MDVQNGARTPNGVHKERFGLTGRSTALSGEQVGVALGAWQSAELRLARCFGECRGLTHEQLEDLYQETALVLLMRSFHSEEHLRHALRWGIKHRALHHHRDERRRGEILAQRAPELTLAAERREAQRTPELAALLEDDRLIVTEFLAELSDLERHVFWLMAEGMRYRAIAPLLAVSVNEARKAARGCEAKRERFQLLYDTGRLCGFRSQTILAMQAGEPVERGARTARLRAPAGLRTLPRTAQDERQAATAKLPGPSGRAGCRSQSSPHTSAGSRSSAYACGCCTSGSCHTGPRPPAAGSEKARSRPSRGAAWPPSSPPEQPPSPCSQAGRSEPRTHSNTPNINTARGQS